MTRVELITFIFKTALDKKWITMRPDSRSLIIEDFLDADGVFVNLNSLDQNFKGFSFDKKVESILEVLRFNLSSNGNKNIIGKYKITFWQGSSRDGDEIKKIL